MDEIMIGFSVAELIPFLSIVSRNSLLAQIPFYSFLCGKIPFVEKNKRQRSSFLFLSFSSSQLLLFHFSFCVRK